MSDEPKVRFDSISSRIYSQIILNWFVSRDHQLVPLSKAVYVTLDHDTVSHQTFWQNLQAHYKNHLQIYENSLLRDFQNHIQSETQIYKNATFVTLLTS